jgi:hypothetical protein
MFFLKIEYILLTVVIKNCMKSSEVRNRKMIFIEA